MSNFRPIDRETGFLLPPSVDDCFRRSIWPVNRLANGSPDRLAKRGLTHI